ncbi:hypothetical protein [Synechocystis salina]|uniref:Uncharacterized protein n=1 Tax=Synechocystis salina LEGE 00031 TaxID=1828736 RepID=A0ABR9VW41_9SYNC|nr:hypothetical protein [Synechocystis salina]MBE9242525.1 hypothetical protein [Synechocystis salina LEGE 00041]MBE9255585.1 hypothetical protein [Synechocystis salina LEGE 00031]
MLSVQTQPTAKVFHFQGSGDHLTKLDLQHRKTGELGTLHIYSRNPLSIAEVKDSIATAFNCDRWAWRQLNVTAEYCPF